ncbi:MAG: caspase family protein [Duncaniella sp.]|nr:caspase family protein [Duncaniella sp.]
MTLPNRDCDLVIAYEDGQMETLHFVYDRERELRQQATLHLLCVGVNKYPAQNLNNLKYAEADAQAVADAFASRHKNTFANISKKVLVGSQVTRNQINAEIERIADDAKPNDLAIIFFAGHGMVDGLNKYYLATSEVEDVTVPRKGGLSANVFAEKISYIGCKLVVFIDACYSAKILESFRSGASNADFFKELNSTPNGTNIYTSSGANSLAREDDSLRHGAFTKALIESCDFSKADTDNDGRITINEVRNYLERRIPELTGNQQSPVHRNLEEISTNYPLFVQ